ncbi:hypothetical protein L209DRAFT_771518 [Thermothelomyces heterothallicus CBS 203.75]
MFRLKERTPYAAPDGGHNNATALIVYDRRPLAAVDSWLRQYRDDQHRPFGGIPMTSVLLPVPRDGGGQRPESSAKHLATHKLFLQFATVVILREQVRAAGYPRLRGFFRRLRNGEQTELDFERLYRRVYTLSSRTSFDLNMVAVVQWTRAHGKYISIFVTKHYTEAGKRLYVEELPADIFPDLAAGTIALASDATLYLGPPVAVLLESDDSAGLAIPGLPNGTILIKSKTVAIPNAIRGKEARSRGKPGFSQGKQFSDVLLNLKGVYSSSTATRPSFMSLYGDFIEPKNVLDKDIREAVLRLEKLGDESRRRFERNHRHETWFQEWDAMAESA